MHPLCLEILNGDVGFVDHQTVSYHLNANSRLEHLTKRHRFESDRTASDRLLVPCEKLNESPRIDGVGPPMVLVTLRINTGYLCPWGEIIAPIMYLIISRCKCAYLCKADGGMRSSVRCRTWRRSCLLCLVVGIPT